jgi:tetratricopeptide (TPR) repeat protein
MLETIRQYSREKLQPNDELTLRRSHLDYYLSFSLEAEPHLMGRDLREWREWVDAELDNLRLAMDESLDGQVEKGLRLVTALHWYYHGRMHLFQESKEWLERLLAAEETGPEELRMRPERRLARAKALNAYTHRRYGPFEENHAATAMALEAMQIFSEMGEKYRVDWLTALSMAGERDLRDVLALMRATGDRFHTTYVLWYLILISFRQGDLRQCRIYLEESLALNRAIGYKEGEDTILRFFARLEFLEGNTTRALELLDAAYVCVLAAGSKGKDHFGLAFRAEIALAKGEYAKAIQYYQTTLEANRGIGYTENIVDALVDLGRAIWAAGDEDLAGKYCEEARYVAEKLGTVQYNFGWMNYVLARVALSQGRIEQASSLLKYESIHFDNQILSEPLLLQTLGILAGKKGQYRRAVCIFGALENHPWLLNSISQREREEYEQTQSLAQAALRSEDFAAAWAEGWTMNTAQAIQYALGE